MGPLVLEKHCWPEQWPITQIVPSSVSLARSWCRNSLGKVSSREVGLQFFFFPEKAKYLLIPSMFLSYKMLEGGFGQPGGQSDVMITRPFSL